MNCAGLNADYCSKYMMWTGIGPALINSLAIMAGFETIYGIHHMLIISFVGIFVYSVYENILQIYNVKKTIFYYSYVYPRLFAIFRNYLQSD